MLRRKLGKVRFYVSLFGLVTLTSLLVVSSLAQSGLEPLVADAQNTPEPRVLQATTTCDKANGLTLTASSNKGVISVGSVITFTATLKSECASQLGNSDASYSFTLYHGNGPAVIGGTSISNNGSGTSATRDILFTQDLFKAGQNQVTGSLTYSIDGSNTVEFRGSTIINVQAPDNSGPPSLTCTNTMVSGPLNVDREFVFQYLPGNSGQSAINLKINCGNDGVDRTAIVRTTQPTTFTCTYSKSEPGTFNFKASALNASGGSIPGAECSQQVVITGSETNNSGLTSTDTQCVGLIDSPLCVINLVLATVGNVIQTMIKIAFSLFVGPVIEGLVSVRTYTDNFADVVYTGWVLLRNLANIIFILAIVAMGVATVFRISGYAFRDMMVKLIIGAFLVNFSLVIPQAILGIAETVQNQFLAPGSGAIRQIANPLFTTDLFAGSSALGFGTASNTIRIFLNVWVSVFAFIMFFGLMVLLAIRMVIIWLLLMTSPLPYAAMVLPATRNLSKIWWTWLIKWAFMTPVIAFMLNLTAIIVKSGTATLESLVTADPGIWGQNVGFMFAFGNAMIPIVFLFATLKIAGSMASGTGVGWIDKGIGMAGNLAGIGAGSALGYAVAKPTKWAGDRLTREARQKTQVGLRNMQQKYAQKWFGANAADIPNKSSMKMKAKRFAYNVLAGDRLYEEKKKDWDWEKAQAVKKLEGGGRAHLEVLSDRSPDYIFQQQEAEERAEESEKRKKQLTGLSQSDRINKLNEALSSKTGQLLEADYDAIVRDALSNKYFGKLVEDIGGTNNINDFYKKYYDRVASTEGADVAQQRLGRLAKVVNADSIPGGKLQYVVEEETAFDYNPNAAAPGVFETNSLGKRKKMVIKKSPEDLATVTAETFVNIDQATGLKQLDPEMIESLASFVSEYRSPSAVASISSHMTPENKKLYRELLISSANAGDNTDRLRDALLAMNGNNPLYQYTDPNTGDIMDVPIDRIVERFKSTL